MNVLQLDKCGKTFLFRYEDGDEEGVIDRLAALAEDEACPLDWLDAATGSFEVTRRAADRTIVPIPFLPEMTD